MDLIHAAVQGDRQATGRLVSGLLPRVEYLVRYLVRGDADTDDISQEALVAILRGLGTFRATGPLQAWVDRVVVRSTFAFIRRRSSERQAGRASVALPAIDPGSLSSGAEEYLAARRAAALLDQLPRDQRNAMLLHHVLEMSVPEIAAQVAAPPETVKSWLRRGRMRLRRKGFIVEGKRARKPEVGTR